MRSRLFLFPVVGLVVASGVLGAQPPSTDPTALHKKLTELEGRIAALQREAANLRQQLDRLSSGKVVVLTPQQAVEAYNRNPGQPVTVELGVLEGTGAFRTGIGPDPESFITAVWDHRLKGGGSFTAIIFSEAFSELKIPSNEKGKPAVKPPVNAARNAVARHIDEHGVRVTGLVRKGGGSGFSEDYYIEVRDPAKVMLYLSIAPKPVRRR